MGVGGQGVGGQGVVAQAILSAERRGVLPLTSQCPFACVFCSNRYNPRGLQVYHIGPRPMEEIQAHLEAMPPDLERVVIGESATRVNEGEPFSHPQIMPILEAVRRRFPGVVLAVTTGAPRLERTTVRRLAALAPLEVTVSLNSADPDVRRRVMGDRDALGALNTVDQLASLASDGGLTCYGSAVALPFLVGWEDLYRTLLFLDERQFAWARIFLPAFTRRTPESLRYPPDFPDALRGFAAQVRPELRMPVTVEPPRVEDLGANVVGVRPGSAADRASLRTGDVILQVGGRTPFSRVDAHELATEADHPAVLVRQANPSGSLTERERERDRASTGDGTARVTLDKGKGERPGWVMDFDIDPDRARRAAELVWHHRGRRTLVLTSELAAPVVRMTLDALEWGGLGRTGASCGASSGSSSVGRPGGGADVGGGVVVGNAALEAVPNLFFGGSIAAAGLLTVGDIAAHLGWPVGEDGRPLAGMADAGSAAAAVGGTAAGGTLRPRRPRDPWPEVILLPREPFDDSGFDLRGVSWREMAATLRVKVDLV